MPYKITWKNRGICWKFYGIVTSKDVLDSNLEIYGDPKFDTIRYQIADFSEAEVIHFGDTDMKKIAYLDHAASRSNPRVKVAIVASSDKQKQILEAYVKYSDKNPWESQLFDSIQAAKEWLSHSLNHKFESFDI